MSARAAPRRGELIALRWSDPPDILL